MLISLINHKSTSEWSDQFVDQIDKSKGLFLIIDILQSILFVCKVLYNLSIHNAMSAFIEVLPIFYRIEVLPIMSLHVLINIPDTKKGLRFRKNSLAYSNQGELTVSK